MRYVVLAMLLAGCSGATVTETRTETATQTVTVAPQACKDAVYGLTRVAKIMGKAYTLAVAPQSIATVRLATAYIRQATAALEGGLIDKANACTGGP